MARHTRHFLLALDAPVVAQTADTVELLRRAGHVIRWAFGEGDPGADIPMRGPERMHHLQSDTPLSGLSRYSERRRMQHLATSDPWFGRAIGNVSEMIALDRAAQAVLPAATERGRRIVRHRHAAERLGDLRIQAHLELAQQQVRDDPDLGEETRAAIAHAVQEAAARVAQASGLQAVLSSLLADVAAAAGPEVAVEILPEETWHACTLRQAWQAMSELTREGATERDVVALAAALLHEAEADLDDFVDLDDVLPRVCLALDLVFHRELHSDRESTPLADDPAAFLAPLRSTRVWTLLTGPVPRGDDVPGPSAPIEPARPVGPGDRLTSVVVLPGAYPNFAAPLVAALQQDPQLTVEELDLGPREGQFRTMGMWPAAVRERLAAALGVEGSWADGEELVGRDVIVADWADKGAVWATLAAPPGARVVVRIHSVDALRPWVHLVDWRRVSDVVVVSAHVRDVLLEAIPALRAGPRVQVIPNIVTVSPAPETDPEPTSEPGGLPPRAYRIVMVGWAQRVKDPAFALEVLAELRRRDQRWTLTLVGDDFPARMPASGQRYSEAFRERLLLPDVREAVIFTGYLEDVAPVLRDSGVVLSSSRRESQPVGLAEGISAGALPVVRRWPQFASRRATDRMFPASWLVDTIGEAADLIDSSLAESRRAAWRDEARAWLETTVDSTATAQSYRRLIRGDDRADLELGSG